MIMPMIDGKPPFAAIAEKARKRKSGPLDAHGIAYAPDSVISIVVVRRRANSYYEATQNVVGFDTSRKRSRSAYASAAQALVDAGLATCAWTPVEHPHIPLRISAKACNIEKVATFCRVPIPEQKLMRRLDASPRTNEGAVTDPRFKLFVEFANSCSNDALSGWARHQALSWLPAEQSQGTPRLKISIPPFQLEKALRFLELHPYPICPPAEKKVLAAADFGDSKAIDSKTEKAIALILRSSNAVPSGSPSNPASALRRWGVLESNPVVFLGGDFSVSVGLCSIDIGGFGEHFCLESGYFSQGAKVEARDIRALVIVENKAAYRECVRRFGHVCAFAYADGSWNGEPLSALRTIQRAFNDAGKRSIPIYLWFDIDGGGISRASHLLDWLAESSCILMDVEDYERMLPDRSYLLNEGQLDNVRSIVKNQAIRNESLNELAIDAVNHKRGVEQEAMLMGYAQEKLTALLDGGEEKRDGKAEERRAAGNPGAGQEAVSAIPDDKRAGCGAAVPYGQAACKRARKRGGILVAACGVAAAGVVAVARVLRKRG